MIKNRCLWNVKLLQGSSWTVRKLFKLREMAQPWNRSVVGDSSEVFLWRDNWHPLGPLFKRFGEGLVRDLGSSLLAKVSSITCNENWKWPRQRNRAIMYIVAHTPPDCKPNNDMRHCVIWYHDAASTFSVQTAWRSIRVPQPIVPWGPIIWFKG